ncbi:hypothetical protein [Burkholderia sp. Bp9142]|uniref:hypothetical protein n=1 Tax=Burkholderia sp. Bp9142 TaxID=2184573 RepID=UPI000F5B1E19|nr:hypothetical protein [Burkholderia sp. Bp9142]RQR42420.1 hypothetical protein DIE22_02560 [Burkholderia sp. Bp9142]
MEALKARERLLENELGKAISDWVGYQVVNDNISYRVPLSDWTRILREFGHGDVIVLSVHLPAEPE